MERSKAVVSAGVDKNASVCVCRRAVLVAMDQLQAERRQYVYY